MREIKYRYIFKTVKTEKMFIDYFTIEEIEMKLVRDWIQFKSGGLAEVVYVFARNQYTGLKDKTGKEIYEGDILKSRDVIYSVLWSERRFGFYISGLTKGLGNRLTYSFSDQIKKETEIISTIYKNPELLENQE